MSKQTDNPLDEEVRYVKGIGPKRAAMLSNLDIYTVQDMLFHIPRDYQDRRHPTPIRDLEVDEKALIQGEIIDTNLRRSKRGRKTLLEVLVRDDTGSISLTWFHANKHWLKSFPEGETILAYGKIGHYRGPQIIAPDYEVGTEPQVSDKFGRILPVYSLTEGISQHIMRKIMRSALEKGLAHIPDLIPPQLQSNTTFESTSDALEKVHYPENLEQAENARNHLAYEELLVFQCALAIQRKRVKKQKGVAFRVGPNVDRRIRRLFPFDFTEAQNRVIKDIQSDMRSDLPMNRLLQGDVGCGKTAVAVYAMLAALADSSKRHQVALMAPTSILAEQHYLTLQRLLREADLRMLLLRGSASSTKREEQLGRIARGKVDLVVGTHALIQDEVEFHKLSLLIIDEQHRFGVEQRQELQSKGSRPDVMIMTATPIPRTLALACFGDMDVSVINEFPPGHSDVETELFPPYSWRQAYKNTLTELAQNHRAFVVFPLVEENEDLDLTSAKEGYEKLVSGVFKDYNCALLHGQMGREKKQRVMEGFRTGEHQVLVTTTVVEVGVDVPEATVMIIQHAERLGLSQLHQLRGRVGRGEYPGQCYLLAEPSTEEAEERLQVLTRTNDGFEIAETDLRIRGPGKLFGTEQSGMPDFQFYDFSDTKLLERARRDAFALVNEDPQMCEPEHQKLKEQLTERYSGRLSLGRIG